MAFFVHHWFEIVVGVVVGIIVGVIVDILRIGSAVRRSGRHLRNKLAERSIQLLKERIEETKRSRDRLAAWASSERAMYLSFLRSQHTLIALIAFGAFCAILGRNIPSWSIGIKEVFGVAFDGVNGVAGGLEVGAMGVFLMVLFLAYREATLAKLDNKEKIAREVAKLDTEIMSLETTLAQQNRKREAKSTTAGG